MNLQRIPAVVKREMVDATLPESYESAKTALLQCVRIDECKEWVNRMAAIASYARQSKDRSMEELAIRIRRRAERRLGELLAELPVPSRGKESPNERRRAAESIGLSQPSAAQLVRVASVPREKFESRVDESPPPTLKQLDPGWSASLVRKIGVDDLESYTEIQNMLSPLARLIYERNIAAPQRAAEILALEIPTEYLNGLKRSALMVSEWLDEFAQHLSERGVNDRS